jgi:molybdopterin-containing oxidoreductase family iron-sulfur binding subunit
LDIRRCKIKSSIADAKGGQVVLLTNTLASPSTEKLIAEFIGGNPNSKHIVYDAVSSSETLDAFEAVYGERALVDYDFQKLHLLFRLVQIFLVTGKVEVMIRDILKEPKTERCHAFN